jgi:hypothetical protein
MRCAGAYQLALPLQDETKARYTCVAEKSIDAQRRIEAQDTLSFETYRQ